MRRTVLNAVAFLAVVALVTGCDSGKATIPTKMDQSLPTVAAPAGGGGKAAAAKKNTQPSTKVD